MKTIVLIFFSLTLDSFTNDNKFTEAMTQNIDRVYKAATPDELLQAVNAFNRIANTEKTRWEPSYYEAFGYIMLANREKEAEKKDGRLDQATSALAKASEVKPDESEIVALEGFIHMIRVTVDPATRGPKFSMLAFQSFSRAVELNPENPRALALMSQMQFGTAKFFKASTDEACATAGRAAEKFATYKSDNPLAPVWGKGMTEELKGQCK